METAVLLPSLLGVALWAYLASVGGWDARWPLFAGWTAVATSAAVVSRAMAPPAAGAGGERTQP